MRRLTKAAISFIMPRSLRSRLVEFYVYRFPIAVSKYLIAAFRKFGCGDLLQYSEYQDSSQHRTNRVFFCRSSTGPLIVKMSRPLLLAQFEKEEWSMAKARSVGVPAPRPVAAAEFKRRALLIYEAFDGSEISRSSLAEGDRWFTLGSIVRGINQVPTQCFGTGVPNNGPSTWSAFLGSAVQEQLAVINASDTLSAGQMQNLEHSLTELLAWKVKPVLHHGDIWQDNILVAESGELAVIDWGDAKGHHPLHTVASILGIAAVTTDSFKRFLDGYGMNEQEWRQNRKVVHQLALLELSRHIYWKLKLGPQDVLAKHVRAMQAIVDGTHIEPEFGKEAT